MYFACLFVAMILSGLIGSPLALAQIYPSKPVRLINPYPAGSGVDSLLRLIAQKMGESLKTTFVVDNRPGANGMIGTELAAKAPSDGYTLVMGTTGALPMNAAVYPKLSYDPLKDFTPISNFAESAFILSVHPSVPAASVKEYIALAKLRPGQITYASFGIGSSSHFGGELFSLMAGVKLVHVPYKGSAPALSDLVAGHVMSSFDSMPSTMPFIRTNRLRALGIGALKRSPAAPDIPTISEAGVPGFEIGSWYALLAPANTPREIVVRLHAEVVKAISLPEVSERIKSVGAERLGNTPEEFEAQIRSDVEKWARVARNAAIRME